MSLQGLRRSAQKMGGGGGKNRGKGGYYSAWTPPSFDKIQGKITPQEAPHVAEAIVIIEGEYADPYDRHKITNQPIVQPAYHYRFHRYMYRGDNNKNMPRTMTCLRGPDPHNPQQCVPCLMTDNKEWDEKSHGSRSNWVFNIAHLAPYHSVPLMKNGQIQTRREDQRPIMVDRECRYGTIANRVYSRNNNKQCEGCNAQAPTQLGSHRYWQIGKSHLNSLMDFNEKILGKICYYTNTGIIQTGFSCPRCQSRILDIASSQFTNDQIRQFAEDGQRCASCGHVDLPLPEYESGWDERGYAKIPNFQMPAGPDGKPAKARPLTLFDVVLWIQREGESTESHPVITNWCRLTKFPSQNGEVDITKYVNESIVPETFDFDSLFSTTTEDQAKTLNRPNPYAAATQQQNFHQYGQQSYGGYAGPTLPPQQYPTVPTVGQTIGGPPQAPIAQPYPPQQPQPQPQPAQPAQPQFPGFPTPGRPNWGGGGS
jgi:hypothetical protein